MAAEIKTRPQQRQPILLHRIDDNSLDITTMMAFTPGEEGLITISEDKSVRIWLKRDTGQYWPSVCHFLTSRCSTFTYHSESQTIFVGQDSGEIDEFEISHDFNKITHKRKYAAHTAKVTDLYYDHAKSILISCGKDKYISWHGSKNGQRFSGFQTLAVPVCIQYDELSHYVFCGLSNGEISVIKIDKSDGKSVAPLKGHSSAVNCLCWDSENEILYSGSNDKSIILWDIGSKSGRAIELQGHKTKVIRIHYCKSTRQLLSISEDGSLVIWNMEIKRNETPLWKESNNCMKCKVPFFWNFKQMWSEKTIGLRQHHCRKCGIAVCAACSKDRTTIPLYGFEFEVRVCHECYMSISQQDKAPTANFYDLKHSGVVCSNIDLNRNIYVTSSTDRVIKLWDLGEIVFK